MMLNKTVFYLILTTLLFNPVVIQAGGFPKTDFEFSLLPPYCKARAGRTSKANKKLWESRLGHDFLHTHHYCAALNMLRTAQGTFPTSRRQKREKIGMLTFIFNNLKYMEEHAHPNYILFPNIYTTKAEAFLEARQEDQAILYLHKAIKANPKYTRPYAMLSDIYLKHGKRKDAKEIIAQGLESSPKSKLLNKRMKQFTKK